MKSLAILLCAGLLLLRPAPARADEASKLAKIGEMLTLMHADEMIQQMMDQIQPMLVQQTQNLNLPQDAREAAAEMQKRMMAMVAGKLSWDKLKPAYIKIYAETLSEEEVDGAVAYYRSPAGQSFLKKMPLLTQKSMVVVQEMMGDLLPEINKIRQEVESKYKKQ